MWQDTYLQRLTESEPFGGWKLYETEETVQNPQPEPKKSTNKQEEFSQARQFGYNMLGGRGSCSFICDNSDDQIVILALVLINPGKYDAFIKEKDYEPLTTFLQQPTEHEQANKKLQFYKVYSGQAKYNTLVQLLQSKGYKSETNNMGFNDSNWKTISSNLHSKYKSHWGSQVATSIAGKLGAQKEISWK